MNARVKICCIRSVAEAALAIRHGATALGLVSAKLIEANTKGMKFEDVVKSAEQAAVLGLVYCSAALTRD